jgi:signal peptidase I
VIKDITKKDKSELTFREKAIINLYDMASVLTVALVTIMLIFTFVFRIVGVVGSSMVPTLHDGDWLMVSAYDREPQYGQVVIATQPNWFNEPIVKRIIATENQTVDINFATGDVFVDGELLDEPYINNPTTNSEGVQFPVTVPEGHVFVMGDNRQGSTDSRSTMIGFIDENYILGVVKYRVVNIDDESGEISRIDFENMKVN